MTIREPTVNIGTPSVYVTKSGPVSYTVIYEGADTITQSDTDITLNKTGTANGMISVSGTGNTTRMATVSNIVGDGTLAISIASGTESYAAGNLAAQSEASEAFTVDNTIPKITNISLAHEGSNMCINSPVTVTFNEEMNMATLSDSSFSIITGTFQETGTISYDTATKTATFTPSVTLKANKVYTAKVTTEVKYLAGNALVSDYTWIVVILISGDINGDNSVNLTDVILALKYLSGINPAGIRSDCTLSEVDVSSNGKIGVAEATHILQKLAKIRTE